MSPVASLFSQFSAFGFSGSRDVVPPCVSELCSLVPGRSQVFVGCARGVDAAVRLSFPHAVVFRASSFPARTFAASLALRSAACVRAVAAVGGCWVSFPSAACPLGVVPGPSPFSGSGSGSWSSLALAVFLRVHCVVLLPCGVSIPSSWRVCVVRELGVAACGGCFISLSPVDAPLSLF